MKLNEKTKIVGYLSKSGSHRAYKQVARVADKFNAGKFRVCLESFGDNPVKFWIDEEKLVAPPANKNNGCMCEMECCQPFCTCEYWCNCVGGNVFDC